MHLSLDTAADSGASAPTTASGGVYACRRLFGRFCRREGGGGDNCSYAWASTSSVSASSSSHVQASIRSPHSSQNSMPSSSYRADTPSSTPRCVELSRSCESNLRHFRHRSLSLVISQISPRASSAFLRISSSRSYTVSSSIGNLLSLGSRRQKSPNRRSTHCAAVDAAGVSGSLFGCGGRASGREAGVSRRPCAHVVHLPTLSL